MYTGSTNGAIINYIELYVGIKKLNGPRLMSLKNTKLQENNSKIIIIEGQVLNFYWSEI